MQVSLPRHITKKQGRRVMPGNSEA